MNELWKRLFLATALLIVTALAAMVLMLQFEFRRGFQAYVFALDQQRATRLVERLGTFYTTQGGWQVLRDDPAQLRFLAAEDTGTRGDLAPRRPEPMPRRFGPGQGTEFQPGPGRGPPPRERLGPRPEREPALRGTGPEWMSRLSLFDEHGTRLHGPAVRLAGGAAMPIVVAGSPVGELYLQPAPSLRDDPANEFMRAQLLRALMVSLVVLALALVVSWLIARRLLAPLPNISGAVRSLAKGHHQVPVDLPDDGAFADLAADIRQLAESLSAHQQAPQQWTADIAHELRTPVAILLGELEAIEDGVRSADARAITSLKSECQRLKRLIDDLYQLSLSDAGGLNYRFAELDLSALLAERVSLHQPVLAQAGLDLTWVPSGPIRVLGDRDRLEQLLANLLGNCERYTDAPGRIRISLEQAGEEALLRVEDSAPGVPDAALPRLFERLYRVEGSRNRKSGGAGLGLSIAERIVSAHRGRISARHSSLGGLAIEIALPLAERRP
ncbi:MAG: two-component sensor histidine kinase [Ahniella sp.]|nr:two-component sensor histidine kinase [Ahniella sp.]